MRALLLVALCLGSSAALADVVSFVPGSSGTLGTSQQNFTSGAITIQATSFYYNGSSWVIGGSLFGRNDGSGSEQGLGICSPGESTTGSCYLTTDNKTGGGDVNELSNQLNQELIRLELPSGYNWNSVQVSSLDNNGGSPLENGILWAGNDPTPSGSAGGLTNENKICVFVASNPVAVSGGCTILSGATTSSPTFSIPGASAGAQYLFFEAYNLSAPTSTNNDYLVKSATVTLTPEPGTLSMLGGGFVALFGFMRRKSYVTRRVN